MIFDFPARAISAIEGLRQKGWTFSYKAGWLPPGCIGYQNSGKPYRQGSAPTCVCGYKNHEHTYSDANRPRGG